MANVTKTAPSVRVRWMLRADLEYAVAIDRASDPDEAWSHEELKTTIEARCVVGQIAELNKEPVGFVVFKFVDRELQVLKLVVHPYCRRKGFGSALIAKLVSHLTRRGRRRIVANLNESNLGGHLFCRRMGFLAKKVTRRMFGNEDGYRFELEAH